MTDRYQFFKHSNKIEMKGTEDEPEDWKEVTEANIAALRYLRSEEEVSHRTVKKVHEIIMKQFQQIVDEEKAEDINPGKYKDVENFIPLGRKVKVFCPPEKVEEKMDELLKVEPESSLEALKFHTNFEQIHPFRDGNGRVGRVLLYYHCKEVLGCEPLMFRFEDRQGYYDLMDEDAENLYIDPEVEHRWLEEMR